MGGGLIVSNWNAKTFLKDIWKESPLIGKRKFEIWITVKGNSVQVVCIKGYITCSRESFVKK